MADVDQLRAQLEAVGAWRSCPACDVTAWSVGSELVLIQAVGQADQQITFGRGWRGVPVFCSNCGFVRYHFVDYLAASAAERGIGDGSPDAKGVGGPETGEQS